MDQYEGWPKSSFQMDIFVFYYFLSFVKNKKIIKKDVK